MEDMEEMWAELRRPRSTSTLWCDGLVDSSPKKKSRRRRLLSDDSDDDLPPAKKKQLDKQEEVQKIVNSLKSTHGSKYTAMQLRIWAELIAGGLHSSEDHPPNRNSMFERAGAGGSSKPTQKDGAVAKVVADAASAITQALTSTGQSPGSCVSISSPAKLIESCSKLYKQLSELQNRGVFDDNQYASEKETIMELLKRVSSGPKEK